MAEPVPPPDAELPLAKNGEVKAYDRHGEKITVPKEQVGQLYSLGGRVARRAEVDEIATQEAYDKQSLGTKVAVHASMLGPIAYPAHAYLRGQGAVMDPHLEAYTQGVSHGMTGGLATVGMQKAVEIAGGDVHGKEAARAYAKTAEQTVEAHKGLYNAGQVSGLVGGAVAGGPLEGIGGAAEGAGQAAARGLGASGESVLGRAAISAGGLGLRGAAEGAVYGAAHQVSSDMLGNHEVVADKVFAAMGLGALTGGVGGAALGAGGSLLASGARRALSGASRAEPSGIERVLGKAPEPAPRGRALDAIDASAGLAENAPRAERAFEIGRAADEAVMRATGGTGGAGRKAFSFEKGKPVSLFDDLHDIPVNGPAKIHLDPDAGLRATSASEDAFRIARGKSRPVSLGGEGGAVEVGAGPIKIPGLGAPGEATAAAQAAAHSQNAGIVSQLVGGDAKAFARTKANDLAYDALGGGKPLAKAINRDVSGGTNAVGEYVNRRILKTAEDGTTFLGTALKGRSDDLLPLIEADRASIGTQIGDLIKANPTRVHVQDIVAPAESLLKEMSRDPSRIRAGKMLFERVTDMGEALSNKGAVAADGTVELSELYYARAGMEGVARELGAGGNLAAKDAVKQWLREVDSVLVNKLDEAAKVAGPSNVKSELLGLKRDYHLASHAMDVATEGANRVAGNNSIGIREGIGMAAGFATGHAIPALATGLAGKMVRERGSAAGAYLLTKMSDMAALTQAVRYVDDQIGKAATGLLAPPKALPYTSAATRLPVRIAAQQAVREVTAMQADPDKLARQLAAQTEPMSAHSPEIAQGVQIRTTQTLAFLTSKIPKADMDPFDPHPAPHMSDAEAYEFLQYHGYAKRPMRFFEDAERGKFSFEGAEIAQIAMPGAFADLQVRVAQGLATLLSQGRTVPYATQNRIGQVLNFPATPSQRPDHMAFLQANVQPSAKMQPAPPKRPLSTKPQQSALDRLEGK